MHQESYPYKLLQQLKIVKHAYRSVTSKHWKINKAEKINETELQQVMQEYTQDDSVYIKANIWKN